MLLFFCRRGLETQYRTNQQVNILNVCLNKNIVKFQYQRMHTRTQIIVIILVPSIHELPPNEAPEALRYHLKKDANVNHDEQQLATAASIRSDCSTPLADVGFQGNITMRSHSPVCQDSWFQTSNKVDRFAIVLMPILLSAIAAFYYTYYLFRYLSTAL